MAERWALLCFIFSFNLPSIVFPCLAFYHTILMQLFCQGVWKMCESKKAASYLRSHVVLTLRVLCNCAAASGCDCTAEPDSLKDISIVKPTRCTCFTKYLFSLDTPRVSDGLSVHHQELKAVHTATGICRTDTATCLPVETRWKYQYRNIKGKLYKTNAAIWYNKICREKQPTPMQSLFDIYLLLYVQSLTPDNG